MCAFMYIYKHIGDQLNLAEHCFQFADIARARDRTFHYVCYYAHLKVLANEAIGTCIATVLNHD